MPMPSDKKSRKSLVAENEELRLRLAEAEELLQTVQKDKVGTLPEVNQQCTLNDGKPPYRLLLDSMNDGAATLAPDGAIVYCNRSMAAMLQVPFENLIGSRMQSYVVPADHALFAARLESCSDGLAKEEIALLTGAGHIIRAQFSCCAIELPGNHGVGVVVSDISSRRLAEKAMLRLNRLYAVLSATAHAIAHVRDRDEIFQEFCRVAVELGTFRLAWVGLLDQETGTLNVVAAQGETGYLDGIHISAKAEPEGMGPSGRSIRAGTYYICNDFLNSDHTRPWHERARAHGLLASASIAIKQNKEVVGALTLYAGEKDFFDSQQVGLLQQMGADVSFALDNLWREARIRGAEMQARIAAERERAALLLCASETRYRTLFENMLNGFAYCQMLFDEEGRPADFVYLEVNGAFGRLTGLENVTGKKVTDIIPGIKESNPELFEIYGRVALTGQAEKFEIEVQTLGIWFSISVFSPERGYFVAVFENITERKQAESALRDSERLYRAIGESIDYGIWACTPDGRNTYLSDSFLKLVGLTQEQCSNFGWGDVLHPDDAENTISAWQECTRTEGVWDIEHRFRGTDGQWHPVLARGVPVRNERGEVILWAGINLDISRMKQAEDRVHRQSEILTGINTIFKAGLAARTEDELGEICLSVAEKVTGSRFGFIGEIGSDGLLHDLALSNPSWDICSMYDQAGERRPPGNFHIHGVYGRVCKDGKGFFTNDPASHPDSIGTPPGHPPLSAFLGVPLVRAGETIGMIAVASREGGYGQEELEALEALAPAVVEAFQHRRAVKSLKESEERFGTMANAMPQLAWIAQPDGSVSWYNQRWYEYTGTSPEQMEGWGWQSVHDPLILPKVLEKWRSAIATGEPSEMEFPLLGADGCFRRFLTCVLPLKDSQGNIVQWLGTSTDITEIIEAKQALHRYELLANNSRDIILFIGGEDGRILEANVAACEAYGYAKNELLGLTIQDLRLSEDKDLIAAQLAEADARGILFESVHRRKNGSTFPVEVSSRGAAEGGTRMLLSVIRDITERKQAEEKLRQGEEKYRLLCQHQEELLEKERMIISRSIHDDIGQGLTAMDLDLGWVGHKILPLGADPELDCLIKEMHCRLDMLIAKVQNITAELRPPLLDNLGLKAAIEWQMREFRRRSGIEFDLSVDDDYASLADHMSNVVIRTLQESLTNIIRHSQATEVTVSLGSYGRYLVLEISDNGRGVTEAELSSSTSFGIMGIKERAESCQGNFLLSGVPNGGTTALLELPLHGEDRNEPDSAR